MPTNTPKPTAIFKLTTLANNPLLEINEFRKHLITWAQNQATGKRVQRALAKTIKAVDLLNAKAESYDFVVKYLEGMEIKE